MMQVQMKKGTGIDEIVRDYAPEIVDTKAKVEVVSPEYDFSLLFEKLRYYNDSGLNMATPSGKREYLYRKVIEVLPALGINAFYQTAMLVAEREKNILIEVGDFLTPLL